MKLLRLVVLSGLASLLLTGYLHGLWPCVVIATALLGILFCQAESRWGAATAALLGGFIAWRPYQDSLSEYGQFGVNVLVLWQAVTLIPVALSLRWGWRRGLRMVWFFPLVWVGGEALRMLGPLGFPFGALAIPAYEQLWLIQIADIGGLHLVSAVIAMGSGLLLDVYGARRPGNSFDWPRLRQSTIAAGIVLTLVLLYGFIRVKHIEKNLQPGPHIAVIQPDVPLDWSGDDYDDGVLLDELKAMSEAAAKSDPRPQLIVWPEAVSAWPLYNPEYYEQPFAESLFPEIATMGQDLPREELVGRWNQRREMLRREDIALQAWVKQLGVPLLFGQIVYLPSMKDDMPVFNGYNAARLLRPGGSERSERQLKIRLFPGGEYLPGDTERLRTWLGSLGYLDDWLNTMNHLQPGKNRLRLHLEKDAESPQQNLFHVSICGEILFPESSAVFDHLGEPSFHITIANEGRFQRRTAQLVPYMTLPFRAVEARRGIARSANTGISGFVSPSGRLYRQVRNANGEYWTGRGFPEKHSIEAFSQLVADPDINLANPKVRAQLVSLTEEIRNSRANAGVSGYSVARIDTFPHSTLYQRLGNWFSNLALLVLCMTTLVPFITPFIKHRIHKATHSQSQAL